MNQKKQKKQNTDPLPRDLDAERAVLGAVILNNELIKEVLELKKSSFYWGRHKLIFRTMMELYNDGEAIDALTIMDRLKKQGFSEDREEWGRDYLSALPEGVPKSINIDHYADIVQKKARLRSVVRAAENAKKMAMNESDFEKIRRTLEGDLAENWTGVGAKRDFQRVGDDLEEFIEYMEEPPNTDLTFGLRDLDFMIGSPQNGTVVIIGGRPQMGKSALANKVALENAKNDKPVGIVTTETQKVSIQRRLCSMISGVDLNHLMVPHKHLTDEDWDDLLDDAFPKLQDLPIYIQDEPGIPVERIKVQAERLYDRSGMRILIIDYIQLLDSRRGFGGDRRKKINYLSSALKDIARGLDIPVFVVSQLSRRPRNRTDKRPRLSDLKEAGALEENADMVLFPFRPEYYEDDKSGMWDEAKIIVSKNKDGPVGEQDVMFKKYNVLFTDKDHKEGGRQRKNF